MIGKRCRLGQNFTEGNVELEPGFSEIVHTTGHHHKYLYLTISQHGDRCFRCPSPVAPSAFEDPVRFSWSGAPHLSRCLLVSVKSSIIIKGPSRYMQSVLFVCLFITYHCFVFSLSWCDPSGSIRLSLLCVSCTSHLCLCSKLLIDLPTAAALHIGAKFCLKK